MEGPQLVKSTRGGYKLKSGGFVYRYQKELSGGGHRWKCATPGAGEKCPGGAKTNSRAAEGLAVKSEGEHDHAPAPDEAEAMAIRAKLKDDALQHPAKTIHRATAEALSGASEIAMARLPKKETLKRTARKARETQKKARCGQTTPGEFRNLGSKDAPLYTVLEGFFFCAKLLVSIFRPPDPGSMLLVRSSVPP